MQRVAAVVQPDSPARLHRIGHDPVVVQRHRYDMRRGPQRVRDLHLLAPVPVQAQIIGDLSAQQRCPRRDRVLRSADRGQRIVLHVDPFGRIQSLMPSLRHDQRDRLTDIAHGIARQQRLRQEAKRLIGLHIGLDRRPQRPQPIAIDVPRSQHGDHTR
jgi:hypothetical protein